MTEASEQNHVSQAMKFAQLWRRLVAQIIDGILFAPINYVILAVVFSKDQFLGNVLLMILMAAYYIGMLSSKWQATIGKRLMNIYVTTKKDKKPSFGRILSRFIAFLFPGLPGFIPSFYVLYLTPQKLEKLVNEQNFQYKFELIGTFYSILITIFIAIAVLLLIWYVPLFFTREKKSVPDMLCGTRVLRGIPTSPPKE